MAWNMILALLMAAAAAYAFWNSANKSRRSKQVSGWPASNAIVLDVSVEEVWGTDSDGRPEQDYKPRISYQYEVGGQMLRGDRFSVEPPSFSSHDEAQKYIDGWKAGGATNVYVNPDNHSEAYLVRDQKAGGWWVGIFFLILAALLALGVFDTDEEESAEGVQVSDARFTAPPAEASWQANKRHR